MRIISRSSVTDDARFQVYNKIAIKILPLLLVSYLLAVLDRVNVSFAQLEMGPALGLTAAMYGFGAGIFYISYCACEIPSNYIMHRIGARIWLARIMIVWGVLSAATSLIQTPNQFYSMRFILGIAEAGFYPGALLYISYWFPAQLRSQATAFMLIATSLASVVGGPVSGGIMHYMDGVGGFAGWQWVFVVEGIPATLLGVVVYLVLRNGPEDVAWLTSEEKAIVSQDLAAERAQQAEAGAHHRFGDAFKNPNVWCIVVANFCNLSTLYGIQFWMPTIIRGVSGATVLATGFISASLSILPIFALIYAAKSSDRNRERRWHATAGYATAICGLVLAGSFPQSTAATLIGMTMALCGQQVVSVMLFSLPAAFLMGAAAAAGFAIITTVGNLAGYSMPFLFGVLKGSTGGFSAGFFVMATLAAVGMSMLQFTPALRKGGIGTGA